MVLPLLELMLTAGITVAVTAMVIKLLVTVAGEGQAALLVIVQVITSPEINDDEL
jgi:hypothetical protein